MSAKKQELIRSVKFIFFSISAGIVQTISFALLNELLHLKYWICYLVALVLSVLWNFTLNRKFTFQSANNIPIAMFKVAMFYVVFTPLSTWWTAFFTEQLRVNEYVVLVATMIINFVSEYLYQRFFVFGKSIDTANRKND